MQELSNRLNEKGKVRDLIEFMSKRIWRYDRKQQGRIRSFQAGAGAHKPGRVQVITLNI